MPSCQQLLLGGLTTSAHGNHLILTQLALGLLPITLTKSHPFSNLQRNQLMFWVEFTETMGTVARP